MNRRRLVFIGIAALLVGSFSSSAVYHALQTRLSRQQPGVEVVIAARDLAPGEQLEERDLKVVTYPREFLPKAVLRSKANAMRASVLLPRAEGDFVTSANIAMDGEKGRLEHLIPSGMRAAAVSVNDVTSVAGFARPGSLVDVLVTGLAPDGRGLQSLTVLQRVRVLAAGTEIEGNPTKDVRVAHVVTLLVTPEEAEKLALATQEGRIQLIIRNPLDSGQEKRPPVNSLDGLPLAKKQIRVKYVPVPAAPDHEIELLRGGHSERVRVKD
jgi:pilus assembly protein CpaB